MAAGRNRSMSCRLSKARVCASIRSPEITSAISSPTTARRSTRPPKTASTTAVSTHRAGPTKSKTTPAPTTTSSGPRNPDASVSAADPTSAARPQTARTTRRPAHRRSRKSYPYALPQLERDEFGLSSQDD